MLLNTLLAGRSLWGQSEVAWVWGLGAGAALGVGLAWGQEAGWGLGWGSWGGLGWAGLVGVVYVQRGWGGAREEGGYARVECCREGEGDGVETA